MMWWTIGIAVGLFGSAVLAIVLCRTMQEREELKMLVHSRELDIKWYQDKIVELERTLLKRDKTIDEMVKENV